MTFHDLLSSLLASFDDPTLDEVLINGTRSLVEVRGAQTLCLDPFFLEPDTLMDWAFELAEQQSTRLDAIMPMAGGVLDNGGYRWHVILPPVSHGDVIISLRRQRFASLSLGHFSDPFGLVGHVGAYLREGGALLVCGLPGAGKSSFLSALSAEHFATQRLLILETIPELSLLSPAWLQLCTRPVGMDGRGDVSIQRIYQEALRLRPDRLLIGEIRTDEISVFEQALDCFDQGTVATLHAANLTLAEQRYLTLRNRCGGSVPVKRQIGFCLIERGQPPLIKDFRSCLI